MVEKQNGGNVQSHFQYIYESILNCFLKPNFISPCSKASLLNCFNLKYKLYIHLMI